MDLFLFGKDAKNAFGAKIGIFPTKETRARLSDQLENLDSLMSRVADTRETLNLLLSAQKTYALRRFGFTFLAAYRARKDARGWLDFDDLILRARNLLTDPSVAQWVLYRLDGGIDHILVDEAQDTSPQQWRVIELLAQEFAAGLGSRPDISRTIFVVGDLKQSIYSFQGADPQAFGKMRSHFQSQMAGMGQSLNDRSLEYSFRSSPAILELVDATFDAANLNGPDAQIRHHAFHSDLPGRVDLWPLVEKAQESEEREWYDPTDKVAANDHRVVLANQIAAEIGRMIKTETIPRETGEFRKIAPGDILILVQRRSELFHEIIRACKAKDLPIAGADRLRIGGELAVKDVCALLSFLSLPDDDLSLAAALRSPLFGWTEADLYTLAHNRTEPRLWAALQRKQDDYPETHATLRSLRNQTDFLSPYELIEKILTRHRGRENLLARLGPEAEDGIDALISQSLAYERSETPSLTGFNVWLEAGDVEIKRQADSGGDRIRVMTTHGAKGLESRIVFLPDTAARQFRARDEIVNIAGTDVRWKSRLDQRTAAESEAFERSRQTSEDERLRLLYVAMTRAEKWLVVCGSGDTGSDGKSWYDLVTAGMNSLDTDTITHPVGPIQRRQHGSWHHAQIAAENQTTISVDVAEWALTNAPAPPIVPVVISPSDLGGDKVISLEDAADLQFGGTDRGTHLHSLLEHLPTYPRAEWPKISQRLLRDAGTNGADILAEARAILDSPELAYIFAPGTLAEVEFSATIKQLGDQRVHGAIDRLIIGPTEITCIDFKSNAVVPDGPASVPLGLLRQMAAYQVALEQIYPEHKVITAILWTRSGTLMIMPHDIVRNLKDSTTTS
jgi:ATP-dependent helicase/nuclease subunit A